mmetsp:Transcript_20980/g.57778  ORF Transcript_20980/g.57778 Transcript_20980/m.57778 type:complete len:302 (+) Transcript_20980:94-999(+)
MENGAAEDDKLACGKPDCTDADFHDDEKYLQKLELSRQNMFKPSDVSILTAASRGDIKDAKQILKTQPELAGKRFEWGFTAAHYAGACGQDEFLSFLAGIDPKMLIEQNDYGQTPMHYAAAYGQIKAVKILARKVPEVLNVQSNDGRTSLDMARSGQCRKFLTSEMERRSMEVDNARSPAVVEKASCLDCFGFFRGTSKPATPKSAPKTPPPAPLPLPSPATVSAPSTPRGGRSGSPILETRRSMQRTGSPPPSSRVSEESARSGEWTRGAWSSLRGKSFDIIRVLKGPQASVRRFDSQVV